MIVPSKNDRFDLKIGDISFSFGILTWDERMKVHSHSFQEAGEVVTSLSKSVFDAVRYCLKDVSGLKDSKGEDYKLKFDSDGYVHADCVNELMNLPVSDTLLMAAVSFSNGNTDKVINPITGKVVEGVSIEMGKPESSE